MSVELSVSIGEALDKYSILEIKKEKILNHEKIKHVILEMDCIYPKIEKPLKEFDFHYRKLLEVNKDIWEDQDKFRDDKTLNSEEKSRLCMKIIEDNDRRFRIKSKINELSNSMIKEQKGYNPKKVLIFHHMGMGDMMTMCGAVRYLATMYDEVLVVCKKEYFKSVELMYKDDKTIKFHQVNCTQDLKPINAKLKPFIDKGYEIKLSGPSIVPNINKNIKPFYLKFYKDIDIPYEYRFKYAKINRDLSRENSLFKQLTDVQPKYIFVHDKPNEKLLKNYKPISDVTLFNVNSQSKIGSEKEPIFNYGKIMENSEELHLLDSAFFCYAQYLDLTKVKKLVVYVRKYYDLSKYFNPKQTWITKLI